MTDVPDYGALMDAGALPSQPSTAQNAAGRLAAMGNTTPQMGAAATKYGPSLGIAPDVALQATQQVKTASDQQAASAVLAANPPVAAFVAKSQTNAALAQNSLPGLAGISNAVSNIWGQRPNWVNDALAPFLEANKQYMQGEQEKLSGGIGGVVKGEADQAAGTMGALFSPLSGALNLGIGPASRFLAPKIPMSPELSDAIQKATLASMVPGGIAAFGDSLAKQIQAGAQATPTNEQSAAAWDNALQTVALALIGGKGGASLAERFSSLEHTPPPDAGNPENWDIRSGIATHATGEPIIFKTRVAADTWAEDAENAGHGTNMTSVYDPKYGVYGVRGSKPLNITPEEEPLQNLAIAAQAEHTAAQVKDLQEKAADTEMHGLVPEKTEEFIADHPDAGDAKVWVDPQALVKLAQEGHEPFPNFTQQILQAAAAGHEVQIPAAHYIAQTAGQPYAEELNAATRFSEDGVSQNSAQQLLHEAAKPEVLPGPFTLDDIHAGGTFASANGEAVYNVPESKPDEAAVTYQPAGWDEPVTQMKEHLLAVLNDREMPFSKIPEGQAAKASALPQVELDDTYLNSIVNSDPNIAGTPAAVEAVNKAAKLAKAAAQYTLNTSHLRQLFQTPSAVGMTKSQFALYSKATQQAQQDLYDKLLKRMTEKITRSRKAEFKAAYTKHYTAVQQQMMSRPDVMTYLVLKDGTVSSRDLVTGNQFVKDGKPTVFYHGTNHLDIHQWKVPEFSNHKVISFAEDPRFASNWAGGKGTFGTKQPFIYIVHLKAKSVADFRNSADVQKALDWYKQQDHPISKQELAAGSWSLWENPEMWKALGWDAARMVEYSGQEKAPNACVANGDQVFFRYHPDAIGGTGFKLAASERAAYPKELIDSLPKETFAAQGISADEAAERMGYDSGEEMLRALAQLEGTRKGTGLSFKNWLKKEIESRAADLAGKETGDSLDPEDILRDAKNLVEGPVVEDLLVQHLKVLAEKANMPFSLVDVRGRAEEIFSQLPAGEAAKPKAFVSEMWRQSLATQAALEKGDWIKAFKGKENQLLSHMQYRQSLAFTKTFSLTRALLKDLASSAQKKSIEQGFLDAIHKELQNYGYNVPQNNLDYIRSLWQQEMTDLGYSVVESPVIPTVSDIKELSVAALIDLKNRIDNMVHLGKVAKSVIAADKKEELEVVINEAAMGVVNVKEKGISNSGVVKRNPLSELNASFSQIQPLFDKLDDNNANGVFNRVLRQPAVNSLAKKLEERKQLHQAIYEAYKKFSNVEKASMLKNIPAGHGLISPYTGKEMELKVNDLIGIAFNLGTDLNRWHIEEGGWGWKPEQYQPLLDKYLTPKMLDFIETVHGLMETHLWPKIAAHEYGSTGLAPNKEQATPFTINGRTLPGGYYTLAKDSRASLLGTSSPDISALFKDKIIVPHTPTGFLKKRVTAQYPVSLDWQGTLFHHLNDVTTRIAYSDYISSAMRFLGQPEIKQILEIYGGPSARRMVMESLQRQTGVSLTDPAARNIVSDIFRGVRKNFYLVNATAKFAILLEHASAVFQVLQVAGPATTARGFVRWASNPITGAKFAWENSAYLRSRHDEVDINMRDLADDMEGTGKGLMARLDQAIAQVGFNTDIDMPFRLTQKGAVALLQWVNHHLVAVPNWLGGYYDALEGKAELNGVKQAAMNHTEAVAFANKIVSLAHGSGAEMDMSMLQSGFGEFYKFMNVYYSYHGTQGNLVKGAVTRIAQGRDARERATGLYQFTMVLLAALGGGLAGGYEANKLLGSKNKPATADSRLSWVVDHVLGSFAAEVPIVGRSIEKSREEWFEHQKLDTSILPFEGEVTTIKRAMVDVSKFATHSKPLPNPIRDLVAGAGYIFGIGGAGQAGLSAQGYVDRNNTDNVHPIRGIIYGPSAEKDENNSSGRRGRGRRR